MASPYLGEIRLFAGIYTPNDWVPCDGSMLAINNFQALYSLLGTTYGGDGHATFAVPDLRGRLPISMGAATGTIPTGGTSQYSLAQTGGVLTVTLAVANIPLHTHSLNASTSAATTTNPTGMVLADPADNFNIYAPYMATSPNRVLADNALLPTGGGQAHVNVMPSLPLIYMICTMGIYPDPN